MTVIVMPVSEEERLHALQRVVMSEVGANQMGRFFNKVVTDKGIEEMGSLVFNDTMNKLRRQWDER